MRIKNQWSNLNPFILSTFLLFLIFAPSKVFSQKSPTDWKLVTSEDGIKVYTRVSEKSNIKEVRITATFDIALEAFIEALNDVPAYSKWVYKCRAPKLISTVSESEFFYYLQSDLPFPLSDRDLVVHANQRRDKIKKTFNTHSVSAPKKVEKASGMVRVEFYESSWSIQQKDNGTIDIDYKVLTDPAGSLPTWLVNLTITQGPLHSFKNLESYARKRAKSTGKI
jgi:hypothetical protein